MLTRRRRARLVLRRRRRARVHPAGHLPADRGAREARGHHARRPRQPRRAAHRRRAGAGRARRGRDRAAGRRRGRARGDRRHPRGPRAAGVVPHRGRVAAPARRRRVHAPAPGRRADLRRAGARGRGPDAARRRARDRDRVRVQRRSTSRSSSGCTRGIELHHLVDDPMYLALPRDHPLARKQRVRLQDVADETWVQESGCPQLVRRLPRGRLRGRRASTPKVGFQSDDYNVVQGLIAAGVGISLLPGLALTNVREDIVVRSLGPHRAGAQDRRRHARRPLPLAGHRGDARDPVRGCRALRAALGRGDRGVRYNARHGSSNRRHGPGFRGGDDRGRDQLPRVARRLVGRAVLAPARLHARLHDRARLHGQDQAGVRPPRREDHRAVGRPGRQPREVGAGHRGDAGHGAQLPDDRRPRLRGREGVRHAGGGRLGRPDRAHARGQPDGPQRLRHRAGQEDQADPRLSDDDRPQLRRGAARDRLAPAHRQAQGRDAR